MSSNGIRVGPQRVMRKALPSHDRAREKEREPASGGERACAPAECRRRLPLSLATTSRQRALSLGGTERVLLCAGGKGGDGREALRAGHPKADLQRQDV